MKRLLALLISVALLAAACAPCALAQETEPTSLTVGTVAEMSGFFYTDLWGNNTSDMDVRGLIHDYPTVTWQRQGVLAVNQTVLSGFETEASDQGGKTYRFTLHKDLLWNDGSALTARDYVFTVLLQSSPELAGLGVSNTGYAQLLGWDEFRQNSSAPFQGVRLLDDYTFTLTVKKEYLPYFYELMLVRVEPTPMAAIMPEMRIADDGEGAYLAAEGAALGVEALKQALLGENGYVYRPTVTCGAYRLLHYDADKSVAEFEKNPYYKGNSEGQKPLIEHVTFRAVANETMMDEFRSGKVDILNKVADGAAINQGLALVGEGGARSINYLRAGFAFLSFACEDETFAQISARKAVAMSLDVNALCAQAMNGYAMPVYGYYGLGQWMAAQMGDSLSELNRYGFDPTGAKALLISEGWTYNANGEPFTEGKDDVRYLLKEERLIPLEIRVAIASETTGAQNLTEQLQTAAQTLNARLTITELPFKELLRHYYRQTARTYNLFLLGRNFSQVFDPYYAFNTGDEYRGILNTTGIQDEQLMELARQMREVDGMDVEAYVSRWYAFQERWMELLPQIPLYSNVYFDFVRPDLYEYQINTRWGWSEAILYASFTPPQTTADDFVIVE